MRKEKQKKSLSNKSQLGMIAFRFSKNKLAMLGLTTQAMQLIQGVVFLVFVAVFADRESLRVIK